MAGVGATRVIAVVEGDPFVDLALGIEAIVTINQIDGFALQIAPNMLDENIVHGHKSRF